MPTLKTQFWHLFRYFVTDGSKFGADYLLYPGDPLLYHAQFTVRVLHEQAAIRPALLIGAARGSHSARKHLLLASVSSTPWPLMRTVLGGTCCSQIEAGVYLAIIRSEASFRLMQCGDMLCRSGQQPCHTSRLLPKVDLDRLDDMQIAICKH